MFSWENLCKSVAREHRKAVETLQPLRNYGTEKPRAKSKRGRNVLCRSIMDTTASWDDPLVVLEYYRLARFAYGFSRSRAICVAAIPGHRTTSNRNVNRICVGQDSRSSCVIRVPDHLAFVTRSTTIIQHDRSLWPLHLEMFLRWHAAGLQLELSACSAFRLTSTARGSDIETWSVSCIREGGVWPRSGHCGYVFFITVNV